VTARIPLFSRAISSSPEGLGYQCRYPADQRRRLSAKATIRALAGDFTGAQADAEKARQLLEERLRERPNERVSMRELIWVYLALKRDADALKLARQAVDLLPPERDALLGNSNLAGLAEVEARTGAASDAIAILRRLLTIPAGETVSIARLKIDPVWDPIRNDPGFQQLLTGSEHIGPFFAELKRRNVYKVAVAYVIGAWALSQGIAQVFPVFDVPNWTIRLLVLLIIIGLPIALVLAWMFELTPEGIKRTATADAMPDVTRKKKYVWIYVVVIGAVISIGLFFLGRYTATTTASAARTEAATVPSKSIAVLPFDNLSRDPDNAFFAEGVQDEILTRLAKVADLKVIARTSTQRFKSAPEDLRDIAKQLGVMNILEGSVQKANDQVRVNVQLINAMTDAHLWAETYDRKLTDIFAVESDIAKTIAETLQAKITGSEKNSIAKAPTANPEAYELYLKGRFFWNKRTGEDLHKAIGYFEQAIAKDPNYALAYVGSADSYLLLSSYSNISPRESLPPARAALEKALALDDSLAEAHASFGLLDTLELHLQQALVGYQRAIDLKPNYATAHHWLALGYATLGQFDPGIAEAKRAIELDPLSLIINADCSWIYFNARRFDEAEAQARKTLEMDSRFFLAHYYLGATLQFKGQVAEAIPEFQTAFDLNHDLYSLAMLGQAYARNGQKEEARKILTQLSEEAKSHYVAPYALALVQIPLGEKDRAIEELEQAYEKGETNYLFVIKTDPLLDDLRGQPRFDTLVQKILRGAK
jgi:TolB-like protein/Tfp pilus assembly protein PilF